MSTQMIGGLIGLVLGIIQFAALSNVVERLERSSRNTDPARILKFVARLDLFVLPLAGYVIGGLLAIPGPAS